MNVVQGRQKHMLHYNMHILISILEVPYFHVTYGIYGYISTGRKPALNSEVRLIVKISPTNSII